MKHLLFFLLTLMVISCLSEDVKAMSPADEPNGDAQSTLKTLIVCYSYTGNSREIADELQQQTGADLLEIQPADKSLNYAANNYRIGTEQLTRIQENPNDESSYPAIDPVDVDLSKYDAVIIATPLWWSQMASNMQTFLFKFGKEMAGKHIGLVVSSHSSGISGVEADAKRLVPKGKFMSSSLWINASNHSRRASLIKDWLEDVGYASLQGQAKELTMTISVNGHNLVADLVDNSSVHALLNILNEGAITYEAHDYGNFEKVGDIGHTLPTNDENITTEPGDLILYQGRSLCIYYDTNTWNFTRMGKIRNVSQQELKSILGVGNVVVTLSAGAVTGVASVKTTTSSASMAYNLNGTMAQASTKGIVIKEGKKIVNNQ